MTSSTVVTWCGYCQAKRLFELQPDSGYPELIYLECVKCKQVKFIPKELNNE